MKTIILILMAACMSLYAVSNHTHIHKGTHGSHNQWKPHKHTEGSASEADVKKIAKEEVLRLIENKELEASWSNVSVSVLKKEYIHTVEWIVKFKNKMIKDDTKQVLYIFVSLDGEVLESNFTGK